MSIESRARSIDNRIMAVDFYEMMVVRDREGKDLPIDLLLALE